MNPPDEERDALTEEYRRASAAEAGRPGAAVRKAVLAEAAAAARQRAPAANDSRYLWRGVAGLAVLGFAVLMWKQVDHRVPGEAPVAVQGMNESAAAPAQPPVPPSTAAPASAANKAEIVTPAPAPAAQRAEAESSADNATSGAAANALARAPAAAPAPATATESFRDEPASRALGKMSAAQDAETDADALLRRYFPAQYESNSTHSVWLVQNAAGEVLRSGELSSGRTFADTRPEIERELGGALLRPWRIRSLQNARGQVIEFAVAQTP